jgi:hypothetical protein
MTPSPAVGSETLYGPRQSRFARCLERREERPDPVARVLRRRLLTGLRGQVLELGCGDVYEHVRSPYALFRGLQRAADWLFLDAGAGQLRNDAGQGRRDRRRRV